ncbi:hypothetical protein COB52_00075 [Candidatus Kaiserbacteria bacterium]|nr:MAG: hypothetical protein COB52_00075 [Candidatus Kaiserbacteria bacterium]
MATRVSLALLDQEVINYIDNSGGVAAAFSTLSGAVTDNTALVAFFADYELSTALAGLARSGEWSDVQNKPTALSAFTNDSGFITSAPIATVNSQTGAVVLTTDDINEGSTNKYNDPAYANLTGKPRQPTAAELTTGNDTEARLWSIADIVSWANQHGADEHGIAFSAVTGDPTDNTNLANALAAKLSSSAYHSFSNEVTLDAISAAFTSTLKTKLDGIAPAATVDQSDGAIKTAYENNANTNVFSDALKDKLNAIEAGAKADLIGSEIVTLYEGEANRNPFTDALNLKLNGIAANAQVHIAPTQAEIEAVLTGEIDSHTHASDGGGSIVASYTAATGNTFAAGEIGYVTSTGVIKADASAESTASRRLVMANEAVAASASGEFLHAGEFVTTGLTEGIIYLSATAGAFTSTKPSTTGEIVRIVGYAESATSFYFDPDKSYIEVA